MTNREQKDYLDSIEFRMMQKAFMEMQMRKDAADRARKDFQKAGEGNIKIFDAAYQNTNKRA